MAAQASTAPERVPAVPVFRPSMTEEEIEAVAETLRSGWIGPGPRVQEFECRFAEFVGVPHAVSTGTGTAALQCTLATLGIQPGDEVIMPSFTWVSIFQVVRGLGAIPVLADIDPIHLTIDPADVRKVVSSRTRCIVAVHHGGQLADLAGLQQVAREHGLWLVDDAAHACGSTSGGRSVGGLTDATCFSFNAMKNLAIGDGGMVTLNGSALASKIARYRSLGLDRDTYIRYGATAATTEIPSLPRWGYDVTGPGQRLHMNDVSAAIGLVQLRRLPALNRRRAELAARYDEHFQNLRHFQRVMPRPGTISSHHMYTVLMPGRDKFISEMGERGVSIGVHYIPIHHFSEGRAFARPLPVTDSVWPRVTTFPLFPDMTDSEQDRVIVAARHFHQSL